MVDADENKKDKNKKVIVWADDISESEPGVYADAYSPPDTGYLDYAGAYEPTEEDYDWDDRYELAAQACQSVHYAGEVWSDYADSYESSEPPGRARGEIYLSGRKASEAAIFDVERFANIVEQRDKEHKATLDRIEAQTAPMTLSQRIQDNVMDYIITAVIAGVVAVGLWLLFRG